MWGSIQFTFLHVKAKVITEMIRRDKDSIIKINSIFSPCNNVFSLANIAIKAITHAVIKDAPAVNRFTIIT